MNILDEYIKSKPDPQFAVDLFKGEWSSKLPPINGKEIIAGHAELFNDNRIKLLNDHLDLSNLNVLELGPLEAGHTFMVHQFGADSITAVESNTRAFLKCLIIKELYELNTTQFLLGDAMEFMQHNNNKYDLCMASGILYHSTHPAKFIELCTKMSNKIFMWTHIYDSALMSNYPALNGKFSKQHQMEYEGLPFTAWQFEYLTSLEWSGFCGGSAPYSLWIEKQTIFQVLKMNGFEKIKIFFEDPTHPLGPNICFIAEK